MQPTHKPHMKVSILVTTFLGIGLIADLLPHPALGPSILTMGVNAIWGDRQTPVNADRETPSIQLGSNTVESITDRELEADFN